MPLFGGTEMKLRQAKKIYWAYCSGKSEQPTHKWNTFIKAQNLFVRDTMKSFIRRKSK